MKKIDKLLCRELEKKQIELFATNHRGRKASRRYIQLIDAQDALKRRGRPARNTNKNRRT